MRYLIASLVPTPDDQAIIAYQQQYKPAEFNITIAPHITLARPAESTLSEVEAIKVFTSAKIQMKSFRVEVKGLGTFLHPESSTVFAKPIDTPELDQLHDAAVKIHHVICKPFIEDYEFEPHITIVKDILPDRAEELKKMFAKDSIQFSYLLDRIYLLKKADHDDFWQDIAELKLA